jgi:hypothetical protein
MNPCGFRSGTSIVRAAPMLSQRASAAKCPDRAALSIVEGQPVAVQSPARKQFGHGEMAPGLDASIPGGTPKVARISFTSAAFSSFAEATAGKNSANSVTACVIAVSLGNFANSREALTTNSR